MAKAGGYIGGRGYITMAQSKGGFHIIYDLIAIKRMYAEEASQKEVSEHCSAAVLSGNLNFERRTCSPSYNKTRASYLAAKSWTLPDLEKDLLGIFGKYGKSVYLKGHIWPSNKEIANK
ncbi:hypothetical protein H5410_039243 [Solanum commersonii]|uniref:Uncharacterized protein n=1 Tax=Solanum commersonii TaxID=4109 RepID=A0A9J5YBB6_SOLCO|nr:hypothetical protein H5410_039243 [Solanum commersonii]